MAGPSTSSAACCFWSQHYKTQAKQCIDPRLQRFYRAGCPLPETPISQVPLVSLDFETTGLDTASDEIVSIGLVPFDMQRIRVSGARHWLLKPQRELKHRSVVIHGITHSDVDSAPDLDAVLDELLLALAGRVVVAHYHAIERHTLEANLMRRIAEGLRFPMIDTLALEAARHRKPTATFLSRLLGRRLPSIRLAGSRRRYGLPHYAAHDALVDAIATAELLQAQIAHHYHPGTPVGELWC